MADEFKIIDGAVFTKPKRKESRSKYKDLFDTLEYSKMCKDESGKDILKGKAAYLESKNVEMSARQYAKKNNILIKICKADDNKGSLLFKLEGVPAIKKRKTK